MRRLVVVALLASTTGALAGSPFNEPTEAQKRKVVVPYIRSLTGCVAKLALEDPDGTTQYRAGLFAAYVARQLQKCPGEMSDLLATYEETYGEGSAEQFIKGPYLSDLPRAVLSLAKPQLDTKVDEAKRREFASRALAQEQEAALQRQAEADRAATVRAVAETRAAEARAVQEKQERVDTAMRSMAIIRDKFYDCVDRQLPGIVRSGETADVLASAAMTICGQALSDVQDAAIEVSKAKEEPASSGVGEALLREQIKTLVKSRVVADAVQAKAGVGIFSGSAK